MDDIDILNIICIYRYNITVKFLFWGGGGRIPRVTLRKRLQDNKYNNKNGETQNKIFGRLVAIELEAFYKTAKIHR